MLQTPLVSGARSVLKALGWLNPNLPNRYQDHADVPDVIPVQPAPAAPPRGALQDTLARAEAEALAGPPGLTMANVEAVLDEMVRPALQADGGDITLIRIEDDCIYVRLVGACSSCPSSVMTMRMGVERLLQDEFPEMVELIQVDSLFE